MELKFNVEIKNTFKIKLVASAIAQSVQRPKNGSSRRCNYTDKGLTCSRGIGGLVKILAGPDVSCEAKFMYSELIARNGIVALKSFCLFQLSQCYDLSQQGPIKSSNLDEDQLYFQL